MPGRLPEAGLVRGQGQPPAATALCPGWSGNMGLVDGLGFAPVKQNVFNFGYGETIPDLIWEGGGTCVETVARGGGAGLWTGARAG